MTDDADERAKNISEKRVGDLLVAAIAAEIRAACAEAYERGATEMRERTHDVAMRYGARHVASEIRALPVREKEEP